MHFIWRGGHDSLLIHKLKLTKTIQNPLAFFYGILDHKFNQRFYEELYDEFELSDETPTLTLTSNRELLMFDWLNPGCIGISQ